jgi:hypothetical protein
MGQVWGIGELHTGFWWGNRRETDHFKDLGVDGKMMLKLLLKKLGGSVDWIDLAWDEQLADPCECDNKSPVST